MKLKTIRIGMDDLSRMAAMGADKAGALVVLMSGVSGGPMTELDAATLIGFHPEELSKFVTIKDGVVDVDLVAAERKKVERRMLIGKAAGNKRWERLRKKKRTEEQKLRTQEIDECLEAYKRIYGTYPDDERDGARHAVHHLFGWLAKNYPQMEKRQAVVRLIQIAYSDDFLRPLGTKMMWIYKNRLRLAEVGRKQRQEHA